MMRIDSKPSSKELVFEKLFCILEEFDRVCKENDLKYSLYGGTLIGAVRDNDFIPWDDDVDVIMLRDDYNKLKKIAEKEIFNSPFFLQTPISDPGSPRMFMRLRDSSTTAVSYEDILFDMNHGIFIDILPGDYIPRNSIKRNWMILQLKICTKLSGAYARYYSGVDVRGDALPTKLLYWMIYPLLKFNVITSEKAFKKFEKIAARYNNKKYACDNIAETPWLAYNSQDLYAKEFFESGSTEEIFHGKKFKIFKEYDRLLTAMYGSYRIPKQEPSRHSKQAQFVDIPFEEYKIKYKDEIVENWKK